MTNSNFVFAIQEWLINFIVEEVEFQVCLFNNPGLLCQNLSLHSSNSEYVYVTIQAWLLEIHPCKCGIPNLFIVESSTVLLQSIPVKLEFQVCYLILK